MKKYLSALMMLVSLGGAATQLAAQQSLGNNSSLVVLAPGSTATVGFVVSGTASPGSAVLVRAVGPSLASFGVQAPVSSPNFQVFGTDGKPTSLQLNFVANTAFSVNWNTVFASVGAFNLAGGETSFGLFALPAGTYTAQVSDSSGKGGTVLFEVYLNAKYAAITSGPAPVGISP